MRRNRLSSMNATFATMSVTNEMKINFQLCTKNCSLNDSGKIFLKLANMPAAKRINQFAAGCR